MQSINDISLIDGIIKINSKESINNIALKYRNNESEQNKFNEVIKKLQFKGFRPLEPIFLDNNTNQVEEFVKRKILRLKKRDDDFGVSTVFRKDGSDEEVTGIVDLDDDLIEEVVLSSLFEEREIFVGEEFFKYTEMGLFFCKSDDKDLLIQYLISLTPTQRNEIKEMSLLIPENNNEEIPTKLTIINEDFKIFQTKANTVNAGWTDDYSNTLVNASTTTPYIPLNNILKRQFPICTVTSNGFFEGIFGPSQTCDRGMNENRRVRTKFWNQNYFLFSSIGCKTKFQKKVETWLASWWEKSYAEKLELGVNYVAYDYEFNVPVFNQSQYNNETTFFEFNGSRYNSNGGVITNLPTGVGQFVFNTSSTQSTLNIYILGYNVTNQNINQVIDLAVNQMINGIESYSDKQNLLNKVQNGTLKYNLINAVPFSNKVRMITTDVRWYSNNDNKITHYFDLNFLFTWKSNYENIGDYLQGLVGSTPYKNVKADIYGAAYRKGQWAGSRLIFNE